MAGGWWRIRKVSEVGFMNKTKPIITFWRTLPTGHTYRQRFSFFHKNDGSLWFVMSDENPTKDNNGEILIYYTTPDHFREFVGSLPYYGEMEVADWRKVDNFLNELEGQTI